MKTYKYILVTLATLSFVSCFKDESTDAVNPISEIIIDESGLEKVYNIAKNDILVIAPTVTQTNKELPLSYTWELFQKTSSNTWELYPISDANNDTLYYKGEALGEFSGRLTVENEDGKAFFVFTLNVNSPYEYGITVLSKDADSRPYVSFMQEPMKEGDEKVFYDHDCLERNNENQFFASNPSDILHTKGSLIIACQGNDSDDEDGAAIYFLNEKTFVVENIVESKEYKTFKPSKLFTPSESFEGVAYPVLSADGKMYSLPTSNAVLQPSHNLLYTYAQTGFVIGHNASNFDIILWDKEVNGLVCIYNGYGPYYCGKKYQLQRDSLLTDEDYVAKYRNLESVRKLIPIHLTSEQKKTSRQELLAIVKAKKMLQKARIATFFWAPVEGSYKEYNVLDNGGFTKVADRNYSLINETTPCIANATYKTMLFPDGNKVMKWYYRKAEDENINHYLEDAEELLTVGSDEAIITSFVISDDHMKTYVAFYEPNQEGKNGSVWVFDTDTGEILEQYNNVCYQPVKMIYKKK